MSDAGNDTNILRILGPEQGLVDPALADAGLPPAVGVHSYQVFRASRDVPELTDQRGWTYHHHVDMACWKSRLYVAWNSCQRDEDVWPSRELYSTSGDGKAWSDPAELFPQGLSAPLRIYFFLASNNRMLVIAGLRTSHEDTDEDKKGGLVIREILANHALGHIFILQNRPGVEAERVGDIPSFRESSDAGFREACGELLADRRFLEQQDRGRLLGPRRMKWHEAIAWPGGKVPGDNDKWVAGKAFSFFQRPDKVWVGVSKMGWTTFSHDDGENWSQPEVPASLVTGKAKVWSQRTRDGAFALVYNPSRSNRFPLIAVSSQNGIDFGNMRIVQGESPIQRYAGLHRSIGPQYVRGISHWADDRSRRDDAMWLVYSMNKEDIWVSRVPLPIRSKALPVEEMKSADAWNIYCPKWSSINIDGDSMKLTNRDPYDYAAATRMIPDAARVSVSFRLQKLHQSDLLLEMDLMSGFGSRRPVRIGLGDELLTKEPAFIQIEADANRQMYSVLINGKAIRSNQPFDEPAERLSRICFRTGPHRGVGGAKPVMAGTDRAGIETGWQITELSIRLG